MSVVSAMGRARFARRSERGFLVIAAIFMVVVLAGLIAVAATISKTAHVASIADLESSRAYQAARAGLELGAYQILVGGTCTASQNVGFPATTLSDFTATVTCTSGPHTEGAATVTVYQLRSNACNFPAGGPCPNAGTPSATYVERELRLTVAK